MATAAELRELDDEELETRLGEAKQELFNMRFELATGQRDNTARIKTLLREREIAAAEAAVAHEG